MSQAELQATIENTRQLKLIQETPDSPEALATIPRLKLADLDKQNKLIPLSILEESESKILYHDLFTNDIVYLDVGFDLHTLAQELLPYVPLFGQTLLKIGTETEDFVKLSQRIGRKTGGVWTSSFTSALKEAEEGVAWLFLRGKATMARSGDLLAILGDMMLTVKLDNQERFKQMVLEAKAQEEASLIPGGHRVIDTRLRAHFNEADWVSEQMNGISQLFFLRQLAQEVDQDWPSVLDKLEALRHILLNRQAMLCNVTLDGANWQQFQPRLAGFLADLPAAPVNPVHWPRPSLPAYEGLTIPAQVNYVGQGANLYKLGYRSHGSMAVISNYLRTTWLWERVRVLGGAYGAFCSFDFHSGVFSYLSYRDPNLLGTLDNYNQTGQFLSQLELSQDELTKSIIGAISRLDAYQLPDAKGYSSLLRYLAGDTDENRQRRRDEILSTTPADFKAFAGLLEQVNRQGQVVVLGSQEAIEAANTARYGWLEMLKVL
jgi:Zn-dependent M16 (insulinase) family peptidase